MIVIFQDAKESVIVNSTSEMFSSSWSSGNLQVISPVVKVIGAFALIAISILGFYMIVMPLVRLAFNGAVIVNEKLANKIDEAHKRSLGLKEQNGGNKIEMAWGSLTNLVLSVLPNVKALSDFDDGIKDPIAFFVKLVPKTVIYMFIGYFMLRGYTATIAEKFCVMSGEIIEVAVSNVDPVVLAKEINKNMVSPDLTYSDSPDKAEKMSSVLAKKSWKSITTRLKGNITKEAKVQLSRDLSEYYMSLCTTKDTVYRFASDENYKVSILCKLVDSKPVTNSAYDNYTPVKINEDKEDYALKFSFRVDDVSNLGADVDTSQMYIDCRLLFKKQAERVKITMTKAKLIINGIVSVDKDSNKTKIVTSGLNNYVFNNCTLEGVTLKSSTSDKNTLEVQGVIDTGKELSVKGLYLNDNKNQYEIMRVVINNSNSKSVVLSKINNSNSIETEENEE